jgi:putative intracellular protease/amidase
VNTAPTPAASRPKALIVISSARTLPLSQPAGHPGISIGFFLVELAEVLARFGDDYDLVLATPDGKAPQLDVNGLALSFHAAAGLGLATAQTTLQRGLGPAAMRARLPALAARRDRELALARRHLGRIPVSEVLPRTDKEAASVRDEVARSFEALAPRQYLSIQELITKDRDPGDDFSLGDLAFAHMPGGHAPMVDFNDNPWMGELLGTLRERGVPISLICHAPVALTSARYRVSRDGQVTTHPVHPFTGARVTTVPWYGERLVLGTQYPRVPGHRTRLAYYVDVALRQAGYDVSLTLNPSAARVIWRPDLKLLTGNGPQAIDEQATQLQRVVNPAPAPDKPARAAL